MLPQVCQAFGAGGTWDWLRHIRSRSCRELPSSSRGWKHQALTWASAPKPCLCHSCMAQIVCSLPEHCVPCSGDALVWEEVPGFPHIHQIHSHNLCISSLPPDVPVCVHKIEHSSKLTLQIHSCINYIYVLHERTHQPMCKTQAGNFEIMEGGGKSHFFWLMFSLINILAVSVTKEDVIWCKIQK